MVRNRVSAKREDKATWTGKVYLEHLHSPFVHLGAPGKIRTAGPHPESFQFCRSQVGQRICISIKFLGNADVVPEKCTLRATVQLDTSRLKVCKKMPTNLLSFPAAWDPLRMRGVHSSRAALHKEKGPGHHWRAELPGSRSGGGESEQKRGGAGREKKRWLKRMRERKGGKVWLSFQHPLQTNDLCR